MLGNPLKYTDPSGHTVRIRCLFCNQEILDYSNVSGALDATGDALAVAGCFFAGCHVDRRNNVITGSTSAEFAAQVNSNIAGMGTPLGTVKMPTARSIGFLGRMLNKVTPVQSVLSDDLASTFVGGRYTSAILEEDTILYRAGTAGQELGQFFSENIPVSEVRTRVDSAIKPVWPGGGRSPIDTVFKVKNP